MTTLNCSRFYGNLLCNRIYQTDNQNIEEVINDPDQNDRIITKKDMGEFGQWSYDKTNECLYTNKTVRINNNEGTDSIIKIGSYKMMDDKISLVNTQEVKDAIDIVYICEDEFEKGKIIACSKSSGLWLIKEISGIITLEHVINSPCCVKITFSDNNYTLLANNECFDNYTIENVDDVTTITSNKYLRNEIDGPFTLQKISTLNLSTGETKNSFKYLSCMFDYDLPSSYRKAIKNDENESKHIDILSCDENLLNFDKTTLDTGTVLSTFPRAYGNGVFIFIGKKNGNMNLTRSLDNGETWELVEPDNLSGCYLNSIAYGNGVFVVVGGKVVNSVYTGCVFRSLDNGKTWEAVESNVMSSIYWEIIAYDNGVFISGGEYPINDHIGFCIAYSLDNCKTWEKVQPDIMNYARGQQLVYGNGVFIMPGLKHDENNNIDYGCVFRSLDNGKTWEIIKSEFLTKTLYMSYFVTYGNGVFICIGITPEFNVFTIRSLDNGKTWENIDFFNMTLFAPVLIYEKGMFFGIARQTKSIGSDIYEPFFVYSTDNGMTWTKTTKISSLEDDAYLGLIYGNDTIMAFKEDTSSTISVVRSNFNVFFSVDIHKSINMKTNIQFDDKYYELSQSDIFSNENNKLTSVIYGNGRFVVISSNGSNRAAYSLDNGVTWTKTESNNMDNNEWQSVSYGQGVFVAVASSGTNRAAYSTEGCVRWTKTESDNLDNNEWQSVTYGDKTFLSVGFDENNHGCAAYSTNNGITWNIVESDIMNESKWQSVSYGQGAFVAVAISGSKRAAYSVDNGMTWTKTTSTVLDSASWVSVTYGDGIFVAVGFDENNHGCASYSLDNGITWTKTTSTIVSNDKWKSVAYYNGVFVAVANETSNSSMYSIDGGITWEMMTTGTNLTNGSESITCGNEVFVAVNGTGIYRVSYLRINDNWTKTTSTVLDNDSWYSVTYGNGTFVALSYTGPPSDDIIYSRSIAYSSDNGKTWSLSTSPIIKEISMAGIICYGNGTFIVLAVTTSDGIYSTDNGVTWNEIVSENINEALKGFIWVSVTYGNGMFVGFVADMYNHVYTVYSVDNGITWNLLASTGLESNVWQSVTYGNGVFVAVAISGSNRAAYSVDNGMTWTKTASTVLDSNEWSSVTYGNGTFVAVARSGSNHVAYSTDNGITWKLSESSLATDSVYWSSLLAYGDGLFVCFKYSDLSRSYIVYSSDNGKTWSLSTSPIFNDTLWSGVTYGDGTFVITAMTGSNKAAYMSSYPNRINNITLNYAGGTIKAHPDSLSAHGMVYTSPRAQQFPQSWNSLIPTSDCEYYSLPSIVDSIVTSSNNKSKQYFVTDDYNYPLVLDEETYQLQPVQFLSSFDSTIIDIFYDTFSNIILFLGTKEIISYYTDNTSQQNYILNSSNYIYKIVNGKVYSVTSYLPFNSELKFMYDNINYQLNGVYELNSSFIESYTDNFHSCDMFSNTNTLIPNLNKPFVGKIISNDKIIFLATKPQITNSQYDGIYYCEPTTYGSNIFHQIYVYSNNDIGFVDLLIFGDDLHIIFKSHIITLPSLGSSTSSNEIIQIMSNISPNIISYTGDEIEFSTFTSKGIYTLDSFKPKIGNIKFMLKPNISGSGIDNLVISTLERVYPVGSIYTSMNNVNPELLFGFGTWTQIKNQFLFAIDSENGFTDPKTNTLMNSSDQTSGEATHTLTTEELPGHTHVTSRIGVRVSWDNGGSYVAPASSGSNQNVSNTESTGGNRPHNNMPPYITCYMWQRTA